MKSLLPAAGTSYANDGYTDDPGITGNELIKTDLIFCSTIMDTAVLNNRLLCFVPRNEESKKNSNRDVTNIYKVFDV